MTNVKTITKKQRAVIEDLFAGVADEQQVLEKNQVSRRVYEKWQTDEFFLREFEFRLQRQHRQSEMIIARYATVAAAKLVQLTESTNPETARKACLDIINLLRPNAEQNPREEPDAEQPPDLTPELAGKLLAALAASEMPEGDNKKARQSLL
ncbi:MAG: hypothetical protein ABII09_04365 [Planctomycetota bacterium]